MSDLVMRLRGQYKLGPDGEFGVRDFSVFIQPISIEAANRIEELENKLDDGWISVDISPENSRFYDIWVKSHNNPDYGVRMFNVLFNGDFKYRINHLSEYVSHYRLIPEPPEVNS